MDNECRIIPGYEGYMVSNDGRVFSIERKLELRQYLFNGYFIVDTFRGALTETLPVHRAVALAWVKNPRPEDYTIVNHLDGRPINNHFSNLEWTDHSGNNYHAVNTGLRNDNIACRIREFPSGQVFEFASIAQAARYMGLNKDTPVTMLSLKKFGALINDCYEFRFADDNTPWFYEGRTERTPVSRYWVVVIEPDGTKREFFSRRSFLKAYQLYRSPSQAIPNLVEFAMTQYPGCHFRLLDSYTEVRHRPTRNTRPSRRMAISAVKGNTQLSFASLTSSAQHFGVDRSSIMNRLNNDRTLDGWSFTTH